MVAPAVRRSPALRPCHAGDTAALVVLVLRQEQFFVGYEGKIFDWAGSIPLTLQGFLRFLVCMKRMDGRHHGDVISL
jgi:hypothetical protein